MIRVACGKCGAKFQVAPEHAGKRGKCGKCGAVVPIPAASTSEEAVIPASSQTVPKNAQPAGDGIGEKQCAEAARLRQQWQEPSNVGKAEALFREASTKSPSLWMAHFGVGEILLMKAANLRLKSGPLVEEGIRELMKAAQCAPDQPEPLLWLAARLIETKSKTAADYYQKAVAASKNQSRSLYPTIWQGDYYSEFAIGAAEAGLDDLALDAFVRAIELNPDYAGRKMPSSSRAISCWQRARAEITAPEQPAASAPQGTKSQVSYDGLYMAEGAFKTCRCFLRFFQDASVTAVYTESTTTPEQVAGWIAKVESYSGSWTLNGTQLEFSVTNQDKTSTIDFKGVIRGAGLQLTSTDRGWEEDRRLLSFRFQKVTFVK